MGLISELIEGWRADPNAAIGGNVYALTILTLINPGFSENLRTDIRALPRDPSPFEAVGGTHFARLLVIDRLAFEGPVRDAPDVRGEYLLFTAVIDGREPRDYLRRLHGRGPRAIWDACAGAPAGQEDFVDWMVAHQLQTRGFFRDYDGSVEDVRAALALRDDVRAFALRTQYATAPDLRARFDAELRP